MKKTCIKSYTLIIILVALFSISLLAQKPRVEENWSQRHHRATISPSLVYLEPNEKCTFRTIMVATRLMAAKVPEKTIWAVNDIPGGNGKVGTIDQNGIYTAPNRIPSPREIHICAEVPQAANKYLFATVIIGQGEPVYKAVHIWSEMKDDPNKNLSSPHGIGLDKDGNILIADLGKSAVLRYTKKGKLIDRIAESGSKPGEVTSPREVTSDVEGRIFILDSKGDRPRVQVFNQKGEFQQIFAEKGRWQGMLLRAHGMGFDQQRRLFIVDVDNMSVKVYDKNGTSLYDWGVEGLAPGQFNAPHGLFVDRSGDVFVTGYYGPTQKFSPDGVFVDAFAQGNPFDGAVYFHSVAGDKWGNVYLSVRGQDGYDGAIQGLSKGKQISIMKFNNNGSFITSWAYSAPEHSESEVVVSDDGIVYGLFTGSEDNGVETFIQE